MFDERDEYLSAGLPSVISHSSTMKKKTMSEKGKKATHGKFNKSTLS